MIRILIILFIVSFVFRIWFATQMPQPFVYDQDEYYGFALGILQKGIHADIYRLYGYPLLISPLIHFFGVTSPLPWILFNSIVDSGTTILIFLLGKKVFIRVTPAFIGSLLYAFNPYTAGYVGVLLSEIPTIFLITLAAFILTGSHRFILSFILGFLPQVRPSFVFFCVLILLALLFRLRWTLRCILISLFFIPFLYNVAGNAMYYKQFSLLSVDPVFAREFYSSLFIERGLPFTDTSWGVWPPQVQEAWGAFSGPKNASERSLVAQKYMGMAIQTITSDPGWYIKTRIAKFFYVWEKHFVYPYVMGEMTSFQKLLIYWGNIGFLFLGVLGLMLKFPKILGWYTLALIIYISLVHSISTSEERFSLPAYPLIFLFAGYAISYLAKRALPHQGS